MFFNPARPLRRIVLDPVIPLLDWRIGSEMAALALEIGH
jgi:hypothetical protein